MDISFGMNIAKVNMTKKELGKHNSRKKYFKDKNKGINWKLTKYNKHFIIANYDDLMTHHCRDYVKNYNKRQRLQGHKKRCKTIKQYYTKHGKKASRNVIFSIGKESDRNKLENNILNHYHLKGAKRKEARLLFRTYFEPKALKHENIEFNKRSKYLKITEAYCHVDEGIIHEHTRMVALPTPTNTKYHRPSFSFSKAIREEGKNKDGRKALSNIINREAPHAVNNLSHVMFNYPLHLIHTGNSTKLSGQQYKHYAKIRDRTLNEKSVASSATSVARSASSAKSNAVSNYKNIISSFFISGYNNGSRAGSKANNKSADSKVANATSSAKASANTATNMAYSSMSTNWASRSNDLDIRESHINTKSKKTDSINNNLIQAFKDEENQRKLNNMNNHQIFRILIHWSKYMRYIGKIIKKAKKKARLIITHAKTTAKNLLMPNKFGEHVLQNFIWNHRNCYPNVFHKNPYHLHGKELIYELNETSHNYHIYDSPQAHREEEQIKARSKDNGITWGNS